MARCDREVVGFTDPASVSAPGYTLFTPWMVDSTTSRRFFQVVRPTPGTAPFARSARIVMVRDHQAELLDTLQNAVAAGKMIADVVKTLAPFFA